MQTNKISNMRHIDILTYCWPLLQLSMPYSNFDKQFLKAEGVLHPFFFSICKDGKIYLTYKTIGSLAFRMQETRLLCILFPRCSDNEERRKDGTWRKRIGKKRRSFSRCRNFPSAVHKKKVRQVKTPETWTKKIPELKVQYVF